MTTAVRASTRYGQIVRHKCNRHSWFRNRSVTRSRDLFSHQDHFLYFRTLPKLLNLAIYF